MILCPVCQEAPDLPQDPKVGDQLECPECGAELEIVSVSPIVFEVVEEEDVDEDLDLDDDGDSDEEDEEDL